MSHWATAVYLSIPLIVSGVLHMALVKANALKALNRPLHEKWFGRNKTWRGLLAYPLLTIPGVFAAIAIEPAFGDALTAHLSQTPPVPLGVGLGLGYALFELPNSYMKRRLGIAPGKLPPRNRVWFALLDQADSAVGCVLAYSLFTQAPAMSLLACLALGPAVHLAVNLGLWSVGLRKEPI